MILKPAPAKNTNRINPKILAEHEVREMGIDPKGSSFVDTLEELRNTPPNIVVADCIKDVFFIQNQYAKQPQHLKKKQKYVMSLGVYQQLYYDPKKDWRILKPHTVKFKNIYRPYTGQDLTDKRLLVMRTGGIGDLLFIQPNLIHLKEKYPTCEIIFACGPQYQSMVYEWDCIDEVIDLPVSMSYIMTCDYHAIFEGVIERCRRAERTSSYLLFTEWLGLNLPEDKLIPSQEPNEESVDKCKKFLETKNLKEKDFVLIQMRASSPMRTPRPETWKKIIDELTKSYNVVFTDAPHQEESINDFMKTVNDKDNVFNFSSFSESISDSIALVSLSKLVIATDSALLHIAASLSIPMVGIYGAFLGEIRLSTYKNADWINCKNEKDNCSPCFQHGLHCCKYSKDNYPNCYDNININELNEKIEKVLK